MAVDLKFARPFIINDATGRLWEVGIGVYPACDDSWATNPFVQVNTEEAVRARGGWLAQWRWLNNARPPDPKARPLLIWVGRPEAPQYVDGIEGGWPPVFFQHLRHFPNLEIPYADFVQIATDPVSGKALYRKIGADERIQLSTHPQPRIEQMGAVKLYPGDPSPPLAPTGSLDVGRVRREEHRHRWQQAAQLAAINAEAVRYTAELPAQPAPAPRPITVEAAIWRDPRQVQHAPHTEQPQPSATAQALPDHAIYAARVRGRLQRASPAI
jgi:hypothetical protein